MKSPARPICVCLAVLFFLGVIPAGRAQDATTAGVKPGYARRQPVDATLVQPFSPDMVLVMPSDAASSSGSIGSPNAPRSNSSLNRPSAAGGNISGLITVPTFAGAFAATGGPSVGRVFPFIMMGNDPLLGGSTEIPAKITEVSLQLLNADGTTFLTVPYAPFEAIVNNSPDFQAAKYNSSNNPTQFADAVQRAEFFNSAKDNWHTMLTGPQIVNRITLTIPRFVNVQLANGSIITARSYFVGTAPDGSRFVEMLDLLFDFLFDNAVIADINGGNFTTDAVNISAFPNTFLFSLNTANPNVPGSCCVLGFHTFFLDSSATPQPRWISIFASYISPGLFGAGFQDITGLSHEISEAFNDPFGNTAVPRWQFPGQPANSKVCQGNLETGDPVEVLSTATVPLGIKERGQTFIYHPQTEALLQWFEMGATSDAIDGAFSYPDETALTKSAAPCPQ